jgi:50S ribosomal subunit-associated GTPase HflX
MAKALLGHVGAPNQRMTAELRRLRQRVSDLEAQLARLKEEHAAQAAAADDSGHPRSAPSRTARGWPVVHG